MRVGKEKGSGSGGSSLSWVLAGCEFSVLSNYFPPPFSVSLFLFLTGSIAIRCQKLDSIEISFFSTHVRTLFSFFLYDPIAPRFCPDMVHHSTRGTFPATQRENIETTILKRNEFDPKHMRAREKRKVERRSSPANPIQTHTLATDFANPRVPRITVPVMFPFFSTTT